MSTHSQKINYKKGFWIIFAIFSITIILALVILQEFDKSPTYIFSRVFDTTQDFYPARAVDIPEYYYADVDILQHAYSKHVKTLDDFYIWKNGSILDQYSLYPTTHEVSSVATLIDSKNRTGYTLNKYIMPSLNPDIIIFYEMIPNDNNKIHNAIFVIPGSGNQGARDVLGEPSPISEYYYHDNIGQHLVKEGYVVYTMELRGYGERVIDVGSACDFKPVFDRLIICEGLALRYVISLYGKSIDTFHNNDLTQVLAYIDSREYIDKIAVSGLSLGAALAIDQTIINNDIIRAVVIASGPGSIVNFPTSATAASDNIFLCCDNTDLIATIAPKPMYVSFGQKETGLFGWEAQTGYTGNFLNDVYELHDAKNNFYYHVHDSTHAYHIPTVIDFLSNHMK